MSANTKKTTIVAEPGTPFIEMSREFNATPEQLFRAHTDPELVAKWLGPKRLTMKIDEFDASNGGRWRYTHAEEDGTTYGFHGVFHGTPSVKDGIVQTFEFEGWPGQVALESLTFEEVSPGKTILHAHSVYQSVEARDGMIESGMETGVNEGYDQLDELLATELSTR
jgi:uncharacterized protein YndB with AHSA1/START domain